MGQNFRFDALVVNGILNLDRVEEILHKRSYMPVQAEVTASLARSTALMMSALVPLYKDERANEEIAQDNREYGILLKRSMTPVLTVVVSADHDMSASNLSIVHAGRACADPGLSTAHETFEIRRHIKPHLDKIIEKAILLGADKIILPRTGNHVADDFLMSFVDSQQKGLCIKLAPKPKSLNPESSAAQPSPICG